MSPRVPAEPRSPPPPPRASRARPWPPAGCGNGSLMDFEVVERLPALAAAVQGLARGRAEFGDAFRVRRSAVRAGNRRADLHQPFRRRDSGAAKLLPAPRRDPI